MSDNDVYQALLTIQDYLQTAINEARTVAGMVKRSECSNNTERVVNDACRLLVVTDDRLGDLLERLR